MDAPMIREELIRRLYRLSRAKRLTMTELVNLYLEACINHEEQQMATDRTVVKELEAVLVRTILRSVDQGQERASRTPAPHGPERDRRGTRPLPPGGHPAP